MSYRGQRATIMGLGHFGGGTTAARWLAEQGATVTVTDTADEAALADSLPLLADVPIAAFHLGGHCEEDFRSADLIVVNPAVRPNSPWLDMARKSGARLCTELELFMEHCPARMIGVTGSNGKSTTAAMIATILDCGAGVPPAAEAAKNAGETPAPQRTDEPAFVRCYESHKNRKTYLGGNIGGSLLDRLPEMGRDDWVVLEISSFQLWHFTSAARMPHVAVVTGCTPNHLDWHASFADYAAAKQRILTGQTSNDFAVLNTFDPEVAAWSRLVRGKQCSPHTPCADMLCDESVTLQQSMSLHGVCGLHYSVPGQHNRINAACAAAAAEAAGCGPEEIQRGLRQFRPLPQRLEWFATVEGRRFYNDSTATTPESTIAALQSLDMPLWLLAGGKSKGFDYAPLAAEIVRHAKGVALFGSAREELRLRIASVEPWFPCVVVETMQEALHWCWTHSRPDETILLSPACASTDQFRNFQSRGEHFVELVCQLANSLNRQSRRTDW